MTGPPAPPPLPPPPPAGAETAAWWVWVAVQSLALAALACGVKPSAGYPEPVEASADLALAAVQAMTAALLAPALLPTPAAWLRAAAAGVPFSVLAACVAGRPWATAAGTIGVGLAWTAVFGRVGGRPGRVVVLFLTFAVPTLMYARLEYRGLSFDLTGWPAAGSPTLGVIATGLHGPHGRPFLAPAAAFLAASLVGFYAKNTL